MLLKKRIAILLLFCCTFWVSCNQKSKKKESKKIIKQKYQIKYANGFDIQYFEEYKKLIIKTPYPEAKEQFEYILLPKSTAKKTDENTPSLTTPIQTMVATSTTHIPMLELLNAQDKLIGFQNTDYVSSEKTRARIDDGFVKELGKEFAMNTEILFELNPDVVIGFSMAKTNKTYNIIEQNGIPVIINGDWLEETPLGRAEWIKFFGVLLDKEKEADSIFNQIESNYLQVKEIAQKSSKRPTVISGIVYEDIWYSPGGKSFMADFFRDGNLDYYWSENEDTGSIPLSFESVFEKGQNADLWIGCGLFDSKEKLVQANGLYEKLAAVENNRVYTNVAKKGATSGIIYYELAPTRPDLVLKDIIKIAHPNLLPEYTLTFFDPLQ